MAVVKEYRCLAHQAFESSEANPRCPHGCTTVIREFRTAPGTRSAKTKQSDAALERLAKRFGLTDMSNKNGSVANSRKGLPDMRPVWGTIPKGNRFEVGKGEVAVEGSEGGATAALAGLQFSEDKTAPNFMDIAKTLPRLKPKSVGREPGSPTDFQDALSKAP